MASDDCDITTYAWLEHNSVRFHATGHIHVLENFRTKVVSPSLAALHHEKKIVRQSEDPSCVLLEEDYLEIFNKTLQGYVLITQSMYERGLRALLCERDSCLNKGERVRAIQTARWALEKGGLQDYFEKLLGLPITAFESYADLDLLQNLGSAIRHGDGPSTQKVYQMCPDL